MAEFKFLLVNLRPAGRTLPSLGVCLTSIVSVNTETGKNTDLQNDTKHGKVNTVTGKNTDLQSDTKHGKVNTMTNTNQLY